MALQTEAVFAELLAELGSLQGRLSEQLSAPEDEVTLLEAHRWILSILQVATDVHVWADTARPRFVDIVGPYKKWGGDNADAFYCFAPVDPRRTYRVRVRPGDAVYLSLTVYGGPDDGRYSRTYRWQPQQQGGAGHGRGQHRDVAVPRAAGRRDAVDQARARCRVRHHPRLPHRPPHR